MNEKITLFIATGVCALSASCGAPMEADDGEELSTDQQGLISQRAGLNRAMRVSVGDSTSEAEAVIDITVDTNGQAHTNVTANADHAGMIIYGDGGTPNSMADDTRTVWPGASHMLMWHRVGLTGAYTSQRIAPPDGGGLWGDPAIGSYGKWVYATSLRLPKGRFPFNGVSHGPIVMTGGASVADYLAGACIARSSDYGQTFTMTIDDCAYDDGHFYDGTAVLSTYQGKIFAAFNDVDASQIDVWRTDGPTGAIYQTPDPFPGIDIASHPRIKVTGTSAPFLMAADTSGTLWLTRYSNRRWSAPIQVATDVAVHATVTMGGGLELRQANGFDFSLFTAPDGSGIHAAFVVMRMVGGKAVLTAGGCSAASGEWACGANPNWESNPAINSFSPAIATAYFSNGPHAPATPRTVITFQREHSNGVNVALYGASLSSLVTKPLTGWQTPCPDLRGYWGDYDSMAAASDGFHRVFSDSTDSATCTRSAYTQSPLGVSEMAFPEF
jgi:hypothetical protein